MRSLILYFFLLVLKIFLNFCSNAGYKQNKFSKNLLKKSFKFILSKRDIIIIFNFGLMLLPAGINLILEKQNCKRDILVACSIGQVKKIFVLSIKIIVYYI